MRAGFTIVFLFLVSGILGAQDRSPRYQLLPGDRYFLTQKLSQTTRTEDGNLIGNVSLDIRNTLELEVVSVTAAGNYLLNCRYTALELDFFAPQAEIAISSSSNTFIPIRSYLSALEGSPFSVLMSEFGEFLEISGLDSTISNLTAAKESKAAIPGGEKPGKKARVKKEPTGQGTVQQEPTGQGTVQQEPTGQGTVQQEPTGQGTVQQEPTGQGTVHGDLEKEDLVKETIHDAFGAAALRSTANIALYFYDDTSDFKCIKETEVLFNGRPVEIINNFYFTTMEDQSRRVQGIGLIDESTVHINMNDYQLVTNLKGNQTYDFLCDLPTGWIREGMSKQKIQSLSGILNHDELPEGLKIPSITESEYDFKGGKVVY